MYKHILLAADGSDNAIRAANEVVKLVSSMSDVTVQILFVVDPSKVKEEVLHSQNHEDIEFKRKQRLLPIQEPFENAHISYRLTITNGDPGSTIVEYAEQHQIELIVIGSRGLNTLQELVLGSVSHKVVKRAHCPVLIVK
ncbi:universal stress protein [Paenibacillus sp. PK4536]|uniref:universal stress protein n=1 Tax=Paenibacillus sp. PK4536 TaxID=3024576 RepID=UPI0023581A6C|nr:universal stress protein [Paenibacillus sp. PK4536]WIM41084.1 universal stress protein [Paenibacillus sp. PK4536]